MPAGQSPKKAFVLPEVLKKKKKKRQLFSYFLIIHLSRKSLRKGRRGRNAQIQYTHLRKLQLHLSLGNNLRPKLISLSVWLHGAEPNAVSEL